MPVGQRKSCACLVVARPGGFSFPAPTIDFSTFFGRFVQLGLRVGQLTVERLAGKPRLVGLPCVPFDLLKAPVAADGGDLVHRASRICHPPAGRLP